MRKQQYVDGVSDSTPIPTHYVAEYRCDFKNDGGAGSFPVDYDIWLADFGEVPPLAVFPTAATIPQDGTTGPFLISGGIQPYFVASDNATLVTVNFTAGTDNFTVTGLNAGTGTVNITVTDSSSTPQTASVTVTLQ